jgi:hypothetical protein
MSLREELKAIHDQFSGIGDDELLMWDEIINKVLDAVEESLSQIDPDIFVERYTNADIEDVQNTLFLAINKLRGD